MGVGRMGCPNCGEQRERRTTAPTCLAIAIAVLCFPWGLIACCVCTEQRVKCAACGVTKYVRAN
jgi:hypothetical protein